MSKEDALQNVNYKHSSSTCGKPIEVDGVSYPSISAARRAFGVNERAYYRRVEHGMTPEEALKLGNKRKNAKEITVNGKHFPSQKSAVRYYKADKAYYLMKKYGISLEEAIMRVVNERKGRTAALQ